MNEQEFRKAYGLDKHPVQGKGKRRISKDDQVIGDNDPIKGQRYKAPIIEELIQDKSLTSLQKKMSRWVQQKGANLAAWAANFCEIDPGNMEEAEMSVGADEMEALLEAGWCVHCMDFTPYSSHPNSPENCYSCGSTKDWH